MHTHPFFIVDVFAEQKYAGNPLAVVRHAHTLSDEEMQRIAREMNFSETTFILSDTPRVGGYDVRIFTPREEVPFAGHPTLGTAFVILREIRREPTGRILLNLQAGPIPVTVRGSGDGGEVLWMEQLPPVFGREVEGERVARVLGLEQREIDPRWPIREVSTGLPFLIVPLRTLDSLQRVRVDRAACFDLIAALDAKAILAFCPEARHPENHLSMRVFADHYGVPEDPATGSAAGCLGGYLAATRYFGTALVDVRIEQGGEIGRPSLLLLQAGEREGGWTVSVGGRTVMVARGQLV